MDVPEIGCPRLRLVTLSDVDPRVASTTQNPPRPLALDVLWTGDLAARGTDDPMCEMHMVVLDYTKISHWVVVERGMAYKGGVF